MQSAQANATIVSKNPTYAEYWKAGLQVIPEVKGIPPFRWTPLYEGTWQPTEDDFFEWELNPESGYCLITGKVSGVIALDIDYATDEQIAKIRKLLGDTPCAKVGSKGITLFYRYNNEANQNWKKDGKDLVELKANKMLVTLPPSKHRSKDLFYKWVGKSLISCHNTLPLLPPNYAEILDGIFSIIREPERIYKRVDYDNEPDFQEAVEALNYCDPNCSNDEWVDIGMAFRKVTGDAGFYEFDSWSSKGQNYDKTSIRSRWKSFNSRSITFGTLAYHAKKNGYKVKKKEATPIVTINPQDITLARMVRQTEMLESSSTIPDLITNAPRLIKKLTEWVYTTSVHPQPMLSLGAAITTIGFLMGRNFACEGSGIKANLYSICIAGSQEGKQDIVSRCRTVMKEFQMLKNYQTSWTSGSAIENMLEQTNGEIFYITDEMGILMSHLVGKYTNANQQEAVSILLRLYTENYYKGKGYARSADQKPVEIENPFVSICGFTQREPFFDAMSSMQAHTGVLNRMCLFKAPDVRPSYNLKYNAAAARNIPDDLKTDLKLLYENTQQLKVGKDYTTITKEVPFTGEAREALLEFILDIDKRFQQSQINGENIHLFIGRMPEVVQKVALIGSAGEFITKDIFDWAKAVVEYTVGLMLEHSSDISDSMFDRKKNHTLQFIKKRGGIISKTDFTNGCKVFESRREREDTVQDLIDAGKIEVVKMEGDGRSKTAYKLIE